MTSFLERIFGAPRRLPEKQLPESGWASYDSPTGFYSFQHPADWQLAREGSQVQVTPPQGTGLVMLSARYGRTTRPPTLEAWLCGAFETCQPTSKPQLLDRKGWIGFRQTFSGQEQGQPIEWWAVIGWVPSAVVLLAVRDSPEDMKAQRAVYETILASLDLYNPKPPRNRR